MLIQCFQCIFVTDTMIFLMLLGIAYGVPVKQGSIIDLTHNFANGYTIAWPKATQHNLTIHRYNNEKGFLYESGDFTQAEHSGKSY